jgi:hypothetical protein
MIVGDGQLPKASMSTLLGLTKTWGTNATLKMTLCASFMHSESNGIWKGGASSFEEWQRKQLCHCANREKLDSPSGATEYIPKKLLHLF